MRIATAIAKISKLLALYKLEREYDLGIIPKPIDPQGNSYSDPFVDVHCVSSMTLFPEAADIMNITPWLANKSNPIIAQARQFGKIFLFKQIYGGTAASIAEDIKCTTDEAVVYLKKFFAKPDGYWELENEMKSTANLAKEQGWVRSATGRLIFVRESNAMGLEDQNTVGRKSFNARVS